jgi:hypothetical protein
MSVNIDKRFASLEVEVKSLTGLSRTIIEIWHASKPKQGFEEVFGKVIIISLVIFERDYGS